MYPEKIGDFYCLGHLYRRLESSLGYQAETGDDLDRRSVGQWVRDTGLPGDAANPPGIWVGTLLWDWVDVRYQMPPVDREPTAWTMRSLLTARGADCVARAMGSHCESGELHSSPHMRHPSQGGSRLGSVLWSIVCPEIRP